MFRSLRGAARAPISSWLLPRRSVKASLAASQAAAAAAGAPPPIVYQVRFRTRRRIRNAMIGAGVMYAFWSAYLSRIVLPSLADLDYNSDEDSDSETGPSLFIPIPFSFQVIESRPYKGTDPEWQAYIKIAKDRELLLKIRNDILEAVCAIAEASPVLTRRIGHGLKVRKHWLDLDFPYRPPPKIIRNGLLFSAEGLDLVSTEVDETLMMRIERTIWPAPIAIAAYTFVRTLVREHFQDVSRYLGFSDAALATTPPSTGRLGPFPAGPDPQTRQNGGAVPSQLRRILEKAERDRNASQGAGTGAGAGTATGSSGSAGAHGTIPSPQSSEESPSGMFETSKKLVPYGMLLPGIQTAYLDFKKKLAETYQPLRPPPPRGSIGVAGLVELQSPSARLVIEVVAFWDPKTRKYDGPSMHVKVRTIQPRNQVPL